MKKLVIVLSVLVAVLAILWITAAKKPPVVQTKEMWHTNTVTAWQTNTVEKWFTNTVEVVRTNTVVQTVTNEVVKAAQTPASTLDRRAAAAGFKLINAPSFSAAVDSLYKAAPLAISFTIEPSAEPIVGAQADEVKRIANFVLRQRSIPLAEKSPYNLGLGITSVWTAGDPRVAILTFKLQLVETVALQRQNDVIKAPAIVWSTTASEMVRTVNMQGEIDRATRHVINKFCDDYTKAKEKQKELESNLPSLPRELGEGA